LDVEEMHICVGKFSGVTIRNSLKKKRFNFLNNVKTINLLYITSGLRNIRPAGRMRPLRAFLVARESFSAGPALESAKPNAKPGRGAPLSNVTVTSSRAVNRGTTF